MKILLVSDEEAVRLSEGWDRSMGGRYADIDLILSAGDLAPSYLEYLVTVFNVPCLYVRGNHDEGYDDNPPGGCVCIEGRICEISIPGSGDDVEPDILRIAGLGGSIRYRPGGYMFTEREMRMRAVKLYLRSALGIVMLADEKKRLRRGEPSVDILLTHSPCRGHGDLDDFAHTGFECFNWLHDALHPRYHCYGHVHTRYGMIKRITTHPSGATLINVSGMYILEI